MVGRFLCGIGALIWNPADNKYLVLRRAAAKDFAAGEWESVAGRVDQGESFEAALHREVREEISTTVSIEAILKTEHFYRGEARPENELLLVHYLCAITDPAQVVIGEEHSEYRWLTVSEIEALLPIGHWLLSVIQLAEAIRALMPSELRDVYRDLMQHH